MVQQKLAEVCGDVLYCDVSDMETVCGEVLENNMAKRPKRELSNKKGQILINFKMIGEGNQSMDWIGQKLRQSGQQMAQDYRVPTGRGKHLRVSKVSLSTLH